MQPKILRKPLITAGIIIAVDVVMLVLAIVLDINRSEFPTSYTFTEENFVVASHIYDGFGIIAAIALAVTVALSAVMIVGVIGTKRGSKLTVGIIGGALLLAASVVAVMFSFVWVKGPQPVSSVFYPLTDDTMHLLLLEDKYTDNYGTLKIFQYDGGFGELDLLAATEITTFSDSHEDYYMGWLSEDTLAIRFADGYSVRTLQITIPAEE